MPEENEQTEQTERKGGKKWLFLAIGLVLVLILGGGMAAYMFGFFSTSEEEVDEEESEEVIKVNEVISLQPLVANLSADSKMSYARIGITLGIYNPDPGTQVFDRELMVPKIKDQFLASVAVLTSSDLLNSETKKRLKSELKKQINAMLPEGGGRVVEIYFTEFIVQ